MGGVGSASARPGSRDSCILLLLCMYYMEAEEYENKLGVVGAVDADFPSQPEAKHVRNLGTGLLTQAAVAAVLPMRAHPVTKLKG